jgi:hypothetical protein
VQNARHRKQQILFLLKQNGQIVAKEVSFRWVFRKTQFGVIFASWPRKAA